MSVYLPTWCADAVPDCAVCCRWAGNTNDFALLSFNLDGSINQAKSFCGEPYLGLGCIAVTAVSPGDIVDGYIDLTVIHGEYVWTGVSFLPPPTSPPNWPPALRISYNGSTIIDLDPAMGTVSGYNVDSDAWDFVTGQHYTVWHANSRLTVHGCIMLGKPGDIGGPPSNCVYPILEPVPDPVSTIDTTLSLGTASQLSTYPGHPTITQTVQLISPTVYVRSQYRA
jgi:hypothetical protein